MRVVTMIHSLWRRAFANPSNDGPPGMPPPLATVTALQQAALLSEHTNAVSRRRLAS
jgi:hypothetical protein